MGKILYIDDEQSNHSRFGSLLNEIYPTISVSNGFHALELLAKEELCLIVVDIHMPIMNGIEFVGKLKKHPDYNNCPIFFLTSDESDFIKESGLSLEVDDFLVKSMKPFEIKLRVKNHLSRFQALKEIRDEIRFGPIVIKPSSIEVFINGVKLNLTLIEYKIIHYLVMNKGVVAERGDLINYIWGGEHVLSATLNSHVTNLRKKVVLYGIEIIGSKDCAYRLCFN